MLVCLDPVALRFGFDPGAARDGWEPVGGSSIFLRSGSSSGWLGTRAGRPPDPDKRSAVVRTQALLAAKEERKVIRDITRAKRLVDQYSALSEQIAEERKVHKRYVKDVWVAT